MKKKLILILALVAVIAIVCLLFFTTKTVQTRRKLHTAIPVNVQKPITRKFTQTASSIGNVTAKQQTYVTARVNGYISKILFTEGQRVKANTPLIQLDDTQVKSQLAADRAATLMTQHTYTATKALAPKGYASKEELEQAYANYQAKRAAVIADQKALAETTIRAPFDGRLGEKIIDIGDYVTASQKLIRIINDDQLLVSYALPEKYESFIKLNQTVYVISMSDSQQKISGTITFIAPEIDSNTRTITIHATLDNKKHILMPGQYVNVIQSLGQAKSALFIPEQAVVQSLDGPTVFIVKDNKAKQVQVKTGPIEKGNIEVKSGLNKNDEVIVAGQYQVKNGQTIKVAK